MSTARSHGDAMSDDTAPGPPALPPSIELAWGLREHPGRGPKPGLTLERIVAAGIKVALTEGIGVLSMARLAGELGVGTMSLYRYVTAKDELLTLMVDTAIGPPPAAVHPANDWRTGLTSWAVGIRAAYRRHPWALRVPISGPPAGPNNVAWLEAGLRALAATPLSEQQKLSTILLLSGFVRNEATLAADIAAGSPTEPAVAGYGALLTRTRRCHPVSCAAPGAGGRCLFRRRRPRRRVQLRPGPHPRRRRETRRGHWNQPSTSTTALMLPAALNRLTSPA